MGARNLSAIMEALRISARPNLGHPGRDHTVEDAIAAMEADVGLNRQTRNALETDLGHKRP